MKPTVVVLCKRVPAAAAAVGVNLIQMDEEKREEKNQSIERSATRNDNISYCELLVLPAEELE